MAAVKPGCSKCVTHNFRGVWKAIRRLVREGSGHHAVYSFVAANPEALVPRNARRRRGRSKRSAPKRPQYVKERGLGFWTHDGSGDIWVKEKT